MKEKIVCKAKEMFLRLGFKSITMDDIAAELCISKKTIYKFFSNKDSLIETTVNEVHLIMKETIETIMLQNFNAIEENFEVKKMFKEMFQYTESSPLYQLKKHYPEIYHAVIADQTELFKTFKLKNITKGIEEGLFRENIAIDTMIQLYFTLIFSINENTVSEKEVQELEYKALEYHIRAIATPKGVAELEKQIESINP